MHPPLGFGWVVWRSSWFGCDATPALTHPRAGRVRHHGWLGVAVRPRRVPCAVGTIPLGPPPPRGLLPPLCLPRADGRYLRGTRIRVRNGGHGPATRSVQVRARLFSLYVSEPMPTDPDHTVQHSTAQHSTVGMKEILHCSHSVLSVESLKPGLTLALMPGSRALSATTRQIHQRERGSGNSKLQAKLICKHRTTRGRHTCR
jgi:hypothetical protein